MNKRTIYIILLIESITCIILSIIGYPMNNGILNMAAFPFEQIGSALRDMSLSGQTGNIIANIIYIVICTIPILYLAYKTIKKKNSYKDIILLLLVPVLFWVLYLSVNPTYASKYYVLDYQMMKYAYGLTIYTMIFGYIVIDYITRSKRDNISKILNAIKVLIAILSMLLVLTAFGSELGALKTSMITIKDGNTLLQSGELTMTYVMTIIKYIVDILPYLMTIYLLIVILDIIDCATKEIYSEVISNLIGKARIISKYSVVLIIYSQIIVNIIQLIFGSNIKDSNYIMSIPIIQIMIFLGVMLLAHLYSEVKKIKEENDMFI